MEIVALVKGLLLAKGGALASGAGVALLMTLAWKFGLKAWSNLLNKNLAKLLDLSQISDPKEKQLVQDIALAVVRWVEYKLPDRGMGSERFKLAAAMLIKWFPVLEKQRPSLERLIEEAVVRMDEAAKAALPK